MRSCFSVHASRRSELGAPASTRGLRLDSAFSVLGLAAFLLTGAVAPSLAQDGETGKLVVSGEGSATLVPDAAALTVRVVTPGANAPEALNANSIQVNKIVEELKALGIEDRDMQTSGFSINPRYTDRRSASDPLKIIGYEVRNGLIVKVRDLAKLSPVLDAVVSAGANEMGGIRFEASDRDEALDQARKAAIKNARAKAELYAEAAGAELGKIILITEQGTGGGPVPIMRAEAMMVKADVPIQAGEETISASVSMQFQLVQP